MRKRAPARPRERETDIVKRVLDALQARRYWAWRVNAGAQVIPAAKGAARRVIKAAPAGTPDILVLLPPDGRCIGLEVKTATGVLRPSQRLWQAKAELSGVGYAVVRGADEALAAVERFAGTGQQCARATGGARAEQKASVLE